MKSEFRVHSIPSIEARYLLEKHHYLAQEGGVRFQYNYGLFRGGGSLIYGICCGIAIFHNPSVPETMVGCFGVGREDQDGFFELGRFVVSPEFYERNLSSWFLSRSISGLRRRTNVRAVLSYADERFHVGYLYQAVNFRYYGLSDKKLDFWIETPSGYVKHRRGKVGGIMGEWRPRPRKHRYLMVFDDSLECLWDEQPYPKGSNRRGFNSSKEAFV